MDSAASTDNTITVLLMEKIHAVAEENFKKQGFRVVRHTALSKEELAEVIPTIHAIGIRSKTKLPAEILEKAKKLICIGSFCIGTDTTDLKKAAALGIPHFNSPYANSRSVAELVIAEMVFLARQIFDRSAEVHRGVWNKKSIGCYEIRGKKLGIIGYGHVGSQLSVLAESMGMSVIFHDVEPKLAMGLATQAKNLPDLLAQADFVSLHVPKLPTTENLMSADMLRKMKPGSYLLNLSRGKVVDIEALASLLRSGHIAGAAVDVFPTEPAGYVEDFKLPLQGCPNTILTPHIGGSTEEAQEQIGIEVSSKMINFINNGSTVGAVNLPNVAPASRLGPGQTRVLSFHRNVPGVMSAINSVVSSGNVVFQALSTDTDNGYLIADLATELGKDIKEALNKVDNVTKNYVIYQGPGYCGELASPTP